VDSKKEYRFTYFKAVKDFVEKKQLSTFATKPNKVDVFKKIFAENPNLIADQFDANDSNSLSIDYATGTATLKSKTPWIYDDEPFSFRFYTELKGVIDNSLPFTAGTLHPSDDDILRAIKKGSPNLEEKSVTLVHDSKDNHVVTIKGNGMGAYDPSDTIVVK